MVCPVSDQSISPKMALGAGLRIFPNQPVGSCDVNFQPTDVDNCQKGSILHKRRCARRQIWCCRKKRSISRDASGPLGSAKVPVASPPDQAWPAPVTDRYSQ